MPINATAEYYVADAKLQKATTPEEKIRALEEVIAHAPAHKGAENLRALLRLRLAKLRDQLAKNASQNKSQIVIEKEGVAQVFIVGVPNSGKSTFLNMMTNAQPLIADYAFTTAKPEVGVMIYKGANVQLIEIPPIIDGYSYKNPELMNFVRNSHMVIVLIKEDEEKEMALIRKEFERAQIILNKERPKLRIKKNSGGGISFISPHLCSVKEDVLKSTLISHGVHNAIIEFYGKTTFDEFLEALNDALVYIRMIKFKRDEFGSDSQVESIKKKIWDSLALINIFTKQPGRDKEKRPLTLAGGSTIKDAALKIHKDFINKFDYARVWGKSVKYQGQIASIDHQLADGDAVEFHIKKD